MSALLEPVWMWWEVALEDEFDTLHTFRVYANNRTAAIVKAYNAADGSYPRLAGGWRLEWVDRI